MNVLLKNYPIVYFYEKCVCLQMKIDHMTNRRSELKDTELSIFTHLMNILKCIIHISSHFKRDWQCFAIQFLNLNLVFKFSNIVYRILLIS